MDIKRLREIDSKIKRYAGIKNILEQEDCNSTNMDIKPAEEKTVKRKEESRDENSDNNHFC